MVCIQETDLQAKDEEKDILTFILKINQYGGENSRKLSAHTLLGVGEHV